MNDCTSIKQLIQRLMPRQNEIVIGKVVRSNPLHVQILNDDKLILSKGLVIPERILAENLVIQRLSLLLQTYRKLDPVQYVKWHPGGALGRLRGGEAQAAEAEG